MKHQESVKIRNRITLLNRTKFAVVSCVNLLTISIVLWRIKRVDVPRKVIRLGTPYGGWYIPEFAYSGRSFSKLVISAGIGMDVSFDQSLLDAGFRVIALDPLDSCVEFARNQLTSFSQFEALQKGLWSTSGITKFYAPKNIHHDSWSAVNVQSTDDTQTISFDVISLEDLYHSHQLLGYEFTMLKMDIEGAEIEVIKSLNLSGITPNWLGIELDYLSLIPVRSFGRRLRAVITVRKELRGLSMRGYRFALNDHYNFYWERT